MSVNDDYRSGQEMSDSSIDSVDDDDINVSSKSQEFVRLKNKKTKKKLKDQKNKKKKNSYKTKLFDNEASETSGEESNESGGEISKKKQNEMYKEELLKPRNQRDIIDNIQQKYRDGEEHVIDEIDRSDDEIEIPGLRDPKFWRISCNRGKEQEAVTSIMYKHQHLLLTENPLEIVSVFTLKKFPGAIFMEAYFEQHVMKAIEGLVIVRQSPPELIEPEQCPQIFKPAEIEKIEIEEGQWVRVRQHYIYQGDLGRVMIVDQEKKLIKIKVVPRQKILIKSVEEDENKKKGSKKKDQNDPSRLQLKEEEPEPLQEENEQFQKGSKFRFLKRAKYQQEQRKFIRGPKIPIQVQKKGNYEDEEPTSQFFYPNIRDEWTSARKDGFEIITLPVHQVLTGNVKPTAEELQFFYPDASDYRMILQKLHTSLKKVIEQKSKIQVGDYITVNQGDQREARFKVSQILESDNKLIITKTTKDKETGEKKHFSYTLDIKDAKLTFTLYQQVSIVTGQNTGLNGTIIRLDQDTAQITTEGGRIVDVLLSDLQSQRNVVKKIQVEDNVDALGEQQKPGFKRNDLVKFGQIDNDIGCILNISNNEVSVLDITNQIKHVNKLAIKNSINTRNNVVKNMYGNDIRQQDLVVILDGFYKNNNATVLHVYRDNLFLFNGKFDNTQGVIIEKANNCGLVSSSKRSETVVDVKQVVPNEDWKNLKGQTVTIRKGQWAGYRGMIQEVNSRVATIQLQAKNLSVKVPLEYIKSESVTSNLQVGKTPQHHPGMSTRVWDDLDGAQQSVMRAYQSPYIAYQTPMHD